MPFVRIKNLSASVQKRLSLAFPGLLFIKELDK